MLEKTDSYLSWRNAQRIIDKKVKEGKMSLAEAKEVLNKARDSYKSQSYNKQVEALNAQNR